MAETGDRKLIEGLRRGEAGAWQQLSDRYLRLVYHVVGKTLATYGRRVSQADVEDITFDLFQALVQDNYRLLGTIGPPYELKAWLAVSARRRAIDFVRKKKLETVSLDDTRHEEARPLGSLIPSGEEEDTGGRAAGAQAAIHRAMEALSAKERIVVQLFYLKGKKYREIAKVTGVNINSISPTLMRAVEKMQKYLGEQGILKELEL